ncbi:hypothetical protein IFM89_018712 [Coptis chinensis]|uniref:Bifunctional inhibitor/plant lipid transfer protein/seed storage helical domain-containing protein n=1 Tax=Coptis chinensis TaxID=261450 RepID=A0A835I8P9_9MAGN|nr:hypothetical protein IFM89_018712 [Coptis chinensis]
MGSKSSASAVMFLLVNILFSTAVTACNDHSPPPPQSYPYISPPPPHSYPTPPPKPESPTPPTPVQSPTPPPSPPPPKPQSPPPPTPTYPTPTPPKPQSPPPPPHSYPTPPPKPQSPTPPTPVPSPTPPSSPPPPKPQSPPPPTPTYPTPTTPTLPSNGKCPIDALKLGVCANLLGGLVTISVGTPPDTPCCSLIKGLVDLEAAVCLCTAIKANVLGIHLNLPVSLSLLLNTCGKHAPSGFQCAW